MRNGSLILLGLALQLGCSAAGKHVADPIATRLVYRVMGSDPAIKIMRITNDHLREDIGADPTGFVLFSRPNSEIYSVSHDEKSVVVIGAQNTKSLRPDSLAIEVVHLPDEAAPEVAGQRPQHYQMRVSGELCEEAVVVPDLLRQSVGVWRDFAEQLAADHAHRSESLPPEMVNGCDLARHAYAAAWYLDYGLPIRVSDRSGGQQILVDYTHPFTLEGEPMKLPQGYSRYRLP